MSDNLKIPHVTEEDYDAKLHEIDDKSFSFDYATMYNCPPLSYQILRDWVDFFGTEEIDTSDTYDSDGCETCDFGSKYGYRIVIINATRNNPFKQS
jgi:hypothetical protein